MDQKSLISRLLKFDLISLDKRENLRLNRRYPVLTHGLSLFTGRPGPLCVECPEKEMV